MSSYLAAIETYGLGKGDLAGDAAVNDYADYLWDQPHTVRWENISICMKRPGESPANLGN
jgi:hypothetical protein